MFTSEDRAHFYMMVSIQMEQHRPLDQIMDALAHARGFDDNTRKVARLCAQSLEDGDYMSIGLFNSGLVPTTECELLLASERSSDAALRATLKEVQAGQSIEGLIKSVLLKNIQFGLIAFVLIAGLSKGEGLIETFSSVTPGFGETKIADMVGFMSTYGTALGIGAIIFILGFSYIRINSADWKRKLLTVFDKDYRRGVVIRFCRVASMCAEQNIPPMEYLEIARNASSGLYAKKVFARALSRMKDGENVNEALRDTVFDTGMADTFDNMTASGDSATFPAAYTTVAKMEEVKNTKFYRKTLGYFKALSMFTIVYIAIMGLSSMMEAFTAMAT